MDLKDKSCDLCKKNFTSDQEKISHLEGKKHLKLVEQQNEVKCGVYIAGFSFDQTKEDALQYFSNFGGIKKTLVGPTMSYIIIVYENEEEAALVLSQPHFLDGRKLRVEKRLPPARIVSADNEEETHRRLMESLRTKDKLEVQITTFLREMTPNLRDMEEMYRLVNSALIEALSPQFSEFRIFNFGSSTTHLQFNSSDLDIYLDIVDRYEREKRTCLRTIKTALIQSRQFHSVIAIPAAKIPIVKGTHYETGIKCDINFKNMLGVENSNLIRYYLSLDDKLRNILLVIKYWAKIHEISGRNHLFTSYSMVMMFIFYLQQCYSFPSVYALQMHTVPTNPRVIWNMNIIRIADTREIQRIKNVSMLEILKGFFEYYSTFDFDSQVICPYLGETIEKKCFSDISTLPEKFRLYMMHKDFIEPFKYDKPVCLQDPFELNVNTCSIIFKNILERYIAACSHAVGVVYRKEEKNLLVDLFTVVQIKVGPLSKKKKELDPSHYNICLKMPKVSTQLSSDSDATERWFQQMLDFCCEVFDKVFHFKMNETHKRARVGSQRHVDNNVKTFHAVSFVNMWDCRNINKPNSSEKFSECNTMLEREIVISDYIWQKNEKIKPSVPLFECNITLTCLDDPQRVNIELVRIHSYKKMFKAFALYSTNKIPQWFQDSAKSTAKLKTFCIKAKN